MGVRIGPDLYALARRLWTARRRRRWNAFDDQEDRLLDRLYGLQSRGWEGSMPTLPRFYPGERQR